ncbi:hypothetical protein [Clostridioides sp. ZZV14-6105]
MWYVKYTNEAITSVTNASIILTMWYVKKEVVTTLKNNGTVLY